MRRPRFIAEQARNAKGLLGRAIAWIMARETWAENVRAIDALDIQPEDRVLDIGCGHGRALAELARRAPKGRVAGADPSALMAEIAVQRNRRLVRARHVEVSVAGVENLPYADASFDKALCVHVVYFWNDMGAAFREIARVLRPGGHAAFVLRTAANKAAVGAFPPDIYRFRSLDELASAMADAGLLCKKPGDEDERRSSVLLMAEKVSGSISLSFPRKERFLGVEHDESSADQRAPAFVRLKQ